jgi:LDH2 family malate/lactate/ureidoglycolate dehydrogenase
VTVAEAAVRRVLASHGVPDQAAVVTARQLVEADMRGYPAHGVERVLQMSEMLSLGTLAARAAITEERTTPATAVVDAGGGLGPPAVTRAVALARTNVSQYGIAAVALRGAGHVGILATWVEQAAGTDSFALMFSSSEPAVVAPGGKTPLFGTNPLAFGWPDAAGGHVVADFSTSALSRSELLRRARLGLPLPPGTAVDRDGRPTLDAREAVDGGMLPFGYGHKGVLLSLLVSMLAGPLAGGPPAHEVAGTRRADRAPDKAEVLLVIGLDAMADAGHYTQQAERLLSALEADAPDGFHRPARRSAERRAAALVGGIEIAHEAAQVLWPEKEAAHG